MPTDPNLYSAWVRDPFAVLVLLLAGLAGIVVGGIRKWYVWGWVHQEALARAERETEVWKGMYREAISLVKETTDVTGTAIRRGQ